MRSKGRVTGGKGDVGIFLCLFDFCFIKVLSYAEECHSESPNLTTRPELDCTLAYLDYSKCVFCY